MSLIVYLYIHKSKGGSIERRHSVGIVEHIAEHVASAREQDAWALTAATALYLLPLLIYEG